MIAGNCCLVRLHRPKEVVGDRIVMRAFCDVDVAHFVVIIGVVLDRHIVALAENRAERGVHKQVVLHQSVMHRLVVELHTRAAGDLVEIAAADRDIGGTCGNIDAMVEHAAEITCVANVPDLAALYQNVCASYNHDAVISARAMNKRGHVVQLHVDNLKMIAAVAQINRVLRVIPEFQTLNMPVGAAVKQHADGNVAIPFAVKNRCFARIIQNREPFVGSSLFLGEPASGSCRTVQAAADIKQVAGVHGVHSRFQRGKRLGIAAGIGVAAIRRDVENSAVCSDGARGAALAADAIGSKPSSRQTVSNAAPSLVQSDLGFFMCSSSSFSFRVYPVRYKYHTR